MATEKKSFTDNQIATFSKWVKSKIFENPSNIYNVKSIGDMYKRALLKWLVGAPATIQQDMNKHLTSVIHQFCGFEIDTWGKVKAVNTSNPVSDYLQTLVGKYVKDHDEEINAKAFALFEKIFRESEFDNYKLRRCVQDHVEKVIESKLRELLKKVNNDLEAQISRQLSVAFAEIRSDVDLSDPDSLKSTWATLLAETKLAKGEI